MNNKTLERIQLLISSLDHEHFDLNLIFKDNSLKDLGNLINYYLDNIGKITNKNINIDVCSSLLEYFDYNYNISNLDERKINYAIMEEANIIVDDLIKKIKKNNNRSINIPIDINSLIDYSISNYINKSNIDKVLYYIIIKLAILYNFYI